MDDVSNNFMENYTNKNMDADDIDSGYLHPECSIGNLEAVAREAALADGLISFGSEHGSKQDMKLKKAGLRRGKWTTEEEFYATRLIYEFKLGLLPLTDGTTLRTFLSKLLNCDPMRISKKFVGQNCIGKQVFRRRQQDLEKLSPEQIEVSRRELAELERKFLERVAQTNRMKGNGGGLDMRAKDGRTDYEDENGNSVLAPWMIPPDNNTGGQFSNNDESSAENIFTRASSRGLSGGMSSTAAAVAALTSSSSNKGGMSLRAVSAQDDEKGRSSYKQFNYADSSAFAFSNPRQIPVNQFYGANMGGGGAASSTADKSDTSCGLPETIPNVSSLDLLCNIDVHHIPALPSNETENLISFGANNSTSNNNNNKNRAGSGGVDDVYLVTNNNAHNNATFGNITSFASMYSGGYFPWANLSNGSNVGGVDASRHHSDGAAGTIGRANSDDLCKSSSLGGFNSLIEWPSMNNLAVAAETMKSVDDLASLGISTNDSMGLLGNLRGYLSATNMHTDLDLGLPPGADEAAVRTAPSNVKEESTEQSSRLSHFLPSHLQHHSHHHPGVVGGDHDVGYPLDDGPTVVASALALAASGSSSSASVNCSSLIVDATSHIYNHGKVSELVRHPAVKPPDPADSSQLNLSLTSVINNQMSGYLGSNGHPKDANMVSSPRASSNNNSINNTAFNSFDTAVSMSSHSSSPLPGGSSGLESHPPPPSSSSGTSSSVFYDRSVLVSSEPLNDHMDTDSISHHSSSNHNTEGDSGINNNSTSNNHIIKMEGQSDMLQQEHDESIRIGSAKGTETESSTILRNQSVENFWMLVDMGDLPQPDKNVLSDLVWSQRSENSSHRANIGNNNHNINMNELHGGDTGSGNFAANNDNNNNSNNNHNINQERHNLQLPTGSNSNKDSSAASIAQPTSVKYDLQRYNPLRSQLPSVPGTLHPNNSSPRVRKEPSSSSGGDGSNISAKRSRSNDVIKVEGEKQPDISAVSSAII